MLLFNAKFNFEFYIIASVNLWKKVSIFICPIALVGSAVNAYMIMQEHKAHHSEHHEIDHPHFQYQKMRAKVFCHILT